MRALCLLLLLSACAPFGARLDTGSVYRDQTALIASKADFDPSAFQGDWVEVARFPGSDGCAGAALTFAPTGPTTLRQTTRCPLGTTTTIPVDVGDLGRLTVRRAGGPRPVWVLWTDTGYRTAVLVSPDGSGGRILNRTEGLPVDRLRAALEVLDFNGFDTGALVFR